MKRMVAPEAVVETNGEYLPVLRGLSSNTGVTTWSDAHVADNRYRRIALK